MRDEFAAAITAAFARDKRLIFLTGDLGYRALEGVKEAFGSRFINAGVAEQNMVSIAAGLAHEGYIPWIYSIAPFATLRPYEQIRNDICLHKLPVKIVGNGGGFGYGIMGATHHALEDVGAMRLLPHMSVALPLTGQDVGEAIETLLSQDGPGYLRLNLAINPSLLPRPISRFQPWRRIAGGEGIVIITMGPVVSSLLQLYREKFEGQFEVWSVGQIPWDSIPDNLLYSLENAHTTVVLEEHCQAGGLGEALAAELLSLGRAPRHYLHLFARGYPSGRYGSQSWHTDENGLSGPKLEALLDSLTQGSTRRISA